VLGVINLDMIGYADALPRPSDHRQFALELAGRPLHRRGANYGPVGATKTVDASFVYSDHSPFWDNATRPCWPSRTIPAQSYYHQSGDTLDRFDIGFFTGATRSSVGLLRAGPAGPGRLSANAGRAAKPLGRLHLALQQSLAVRLTWTGQSDAAGYNVYRADVSHVGYVKINAAPVAGTSFNDNA